MKKLKKLSAVISAILILTISMTGCNESGGSSENSSADTASSALSADTAAYISDNSTQNSDSEYFDEDDLDESVKDPDAEITLNGDSAQINGNGAEYKDGKICITSGGTYIFSGTLNDGQIYVDTKEKVHIALNGVNMNCSYSSPVFIENAEKTIITVCDGTENTLTDPSEYSYESDDENEPDAVIYSKDDLSLNGSGTLSINANFNEGIACKNDLRICNDVLNINSVGNSVKGKDSLVIMNASVTVDSQADGLKSTNSKETDKGYIVIESGSFDITAALDAFQAETDMIINGGTFNIKTGGGTENLTSSKSSGNNSARPAEGNSNKTDESEKGIKAGGKLTINAGEISADCADDSIHSNDSIEINGGTLLLASGDDGIHADNQLDVNDGDITVSQSYEGLEATVINVNDGNIHVTASDDGFNASEGSSDNSTTDGSSSDGQQTDGNQNGSTPPGGFRGMGGFDPNDGSSDNSTTDNSSADGQQTDGNQNGSTPPGGFGGMGGGFGDVSENCILNINGGYIYVNCCLTRKTQKPDTQITKKGP